jgi:Tfp pilus assembly protein PilV
MKNNFSKQHGQTLIETLVACFILVMGIAAAIGLATYSLRATNTIKQQTIGMGLAREGLEVVKNMRDTNWLRSEIATDCYNFADEETPEDTGLCYKDWLNPTNGTGYDMSAITEKGGQNYSLRFTSGELPWQLVPTDTDFGLNFGTAMRNSNGVFYNGLEGLTPINGSSGFARKITISQDTFAPFDHADDLGPRLKVTSQVWWSGKDCVMTPDVNPSKTCSITLQTYLTNWRVF